MEWHHFHQASSDLVTHALSHHFVKLPVFVLHFKIFFVFIFAAFMHFVRILWLALCALQVAAALVLAHKMVGSRTAPPREWTLRPQAVDLGAPVSFMLAFRVEAERSAIVAARALGVSDPESPTYRQFLPREEIVELVRVPAALLQIAREALAAHGIHECAELGGDALECHSDVRSASAFFNASFREFEHARTHRRVVRVWGPYSWPESLVDAVELVVGINSVPVPHLQTRRWCAQLGESHPCRGSRRVRGRAQDDLVAMIPQAYWQVYNIPPQKASSAAQSTQGISRLDFVLSLLLLLFILALGKSGVVEFSGENFAPTDVQTYATSLDLQVVLPTANTTIGPSAWCIKVQANFCNPVAHLFL